MHCVLRCQSRLCGADAISVSHNNINNKMVNKLYQPLELFLWHTEICQKPALIQFQLYLSIPTFQEVVGPKPPPLFLGMHDDNEVFITGGWVHFPPLWNVKIFIFLYFLVDINVAARMKSCEPKILHFCVVYLPHKALTDSIMVRNKKDKEEYLTLTWMQPEQRDIHLQLDPVIPDLKGDSVCLAKMRNINLSNLALDNFSILIFLVWIQLCSSIFPLLTQKRSEP